MGVFTVGRQVSLEIPMPGWWLSGASIDMDFRRGLYYDSSTPNPRAATDFLSCSRASIGYAKTSTGTWTAFASNELRITDLGFLNEESRTNYLLNSDAPATQTTGSLGTGSYTLWVEGSGSALVSAGSAAITGAASATQDNPDTFTVTGAGTVTVTVSGLLTKFQLEAGSFASSFILTAGVTTTRAADAVLTIGGLNTLLSTLPHSDVIDVISSVAITDQRTLLGDDTHGPADFWSNSHDSSVDSTASPPNLNATFGSGLFSTGAKVAVGNSSGARSLVGNGGTVATDATPPAMTSGSIYLGSGAAGFRVWNGYIRRVTFWNSKLADATLQGFTV